MSEMAKIRAQINAENDAALQGMQGLAIFASHASITARMEQMYERVHSLYRQGKNEEAQALLANDDLWNM